VRFGALKKCRFLVAALLGMTRGSSEALQPSEALQAEYIGPSLRSG
jgi:hypothetical protein